MGQRLADYGHERCAWRVVGRGEIAASEKGNAGGFEVVSLGEVIRGNNPAFARRFYIAFGRNQTSRSLTDNWDIRGKANRLHAGGWLGGVVAARRENHRPFAEWDSREPAARERR